MDGLVRHPEPGFTVEGIETQHRTPLAEFLEQRHLDPEAPIEVSDADLARVGAGLDEQVQDLDGDGLAEVILGTSDGRVRLFR